MEQLKADGTTLEGPWPHPAGAAEAAPRWGLAKRLGFRFAFAYLLLYNLPFPLDTIPYVDTVAGWYLQLWQAAVPWVGRHVFHTEITVFPNGSGDTTFNWVQVFCYLVLALAATAVWSLLDRRRTAYPRLAEWLRVYVRFSLAVSLISYGAVKVIPSQFPPPTVDRLLQPFGDASPMGLVWTFIGASPAYEMFSGFAELVSGILLTFRRTTLLGALAGTAVLTNVVLLNFCYDVPVKLYSSHLLLMALFVAGYDLPRLLDFLLLNRRTEPAVDRPLFRRRSLHRGALAVRTLFVVAMVGLFFYNARQTQQRYGVLAPKSPLQGVWNVEEMKIDGQVRPPDLDDAGRWRRIVFDYPGVLAIQFMDNSRYRYTLKITPHDFALGKRDDLAWKGSLSYARPEREVLTVAGTLEGKKIDVRLRRVPTPAFRLKERGFHWINETPFNR